MNGPPPTDILPSVRAFLAAGYGSDAIQFLAEQLVKLDERTIMLTSALTSPPLDARLAQAQAETTTALVTADRTIADLRAKLAALLPEPELRAKAEHEVADLRARLATAERDRDANARTRDERWERCKVAEARVAELEGTLDACHRRLTSAESRASGENCAVCHKPTKTTVCGYGARIPSCDTGPCSDRAREAIGFIRDGAVPSLTATNADLAAKVERLERQRDDMANALGEARADLERERTTQAVDTLSLPTSAPPIAGPGRAEEGRAPSSPVVEGPVWSAPDRHGWSKARMGRVELDVTYRDGHGLWRVATPGFDGDVAPDLATAKRAAVAFALGLNGATRGPEVDVEAVDPNGMNDAQWAEWLADRAARLQHVGRPRCDATGPLGGAGLVVPMLGQASRARRRHPGHPRSDVTRTRQPHMGGEGPAHLPPGDVTAPSAAMAARCPTCDREECPRRMFVRAFMVERGLAPDSEEWASRLCVGSRDDLDECDALAVDWRARAVTAEARADKAEREVATLRLTANLAASAAWNALGQPAGEIALLPMVERLAAEVARLTGAVTIESGNVITVARVALGLPEVADEGWSALATRVQEAVENLTADAARWHEATQAIGEVVEVVATLDSRGYISSGTGLYVDTGPADIDNGPHDSGGNGEATIQVADGDPTTLTAMAACVALTRRLVGIAGRG